MASPTIISKACLLLTALLLTLPASAQRRFRVMEYNVENLFDTIHDAGKADEEFLPSAERQWTSRRYWKKLGRLRSVIAAASGESPADLIALCEVENDSVLTHLTRRTLLHRLGYEYVMTDCRDVRGIDVALIYQPMRFRPVEVQPIRIHFTSKRARPTRDILHVAGLLPTGDTLDVFVCHFPSRAGGTVSATQRQQAASQLRQHADSVAAARACPLLLITGDFNDEPHCASLRSALGAVPMEKAAQPLQPHALYLLTGNLYGHHDIAGTYKYRQQWNRLDHFIVNGKLLCPETRFHAVPGSCRILQDDFLLEADGFDTVKPKRTYLGTFYRGGFSDHLPIVMDFCY